MGQRVFVVRLPCHISAPLRSCVSEGGVLVELMHTDDDLMAVNTQEWDLVARLLAVVAPHEDGACPGAQLSRHRASRIWTLTDGTVKVDVRCGGTIPGLGEPVWMTARAVWFAVETAKEDGPFCGVTIDDRRDENGTVAAVVAGDGYDAKFDLPYQDPVPTLRPPAPDAVLATVITDMRALRRALTAAVLTPIGVPVSGPPVGTFSLERDALVLTGTDRRGVDREAEVRVRGDVQRELSVAIDVQLRVGLVPLLSIVEELPSGEVIVSLVSSGELWLIAGPCRVVLEGELRQLDPYDADGVIFLVGHVQGTDEAVLSLQGGCPVDDTIVWLESAPEDYGSVEGIEEHYEIVWFAEPEPYGVSTIDD